MDITSTAIPAAAVSVPQLQGYINMLFSNPIIPLVLGFMGAQAKSIYTVVKTDLVAAVSWMASKKGQAVTKDVTQIAADLEQALTDAGHPAPAQVTSTLNGLLQQLPNLKAPRMILVLIGAALLMAQTAKAGINFGEISISPTASGAPILTVQPSVSSTFYKLSNFTLLPETDAVGGVDILMNWGNYQAGIEGAFDYDSATQIDYLAAGLVLGVAPYGDLELLWRNESPIVGYSVPLGVGAQTN